MTPHVSVQTQEPAVATVPRLFPGSTIVCIASGPSLTPEDVDYVRGKAPVVVVNTSHQLAPWADVLYACDNKWWTWHNGARSFTGLRYALDARAAVLWGVTVLRNTGEEGLELDPSGVRTGNNSGYQAINVAVHLGASRIVLLGYDMKTTKRCHWHAPHPDRSKPSSFAKLVARYHTLAQPLRQAGVQVVNCTPGSALTMFPRADLMAVEW